MKDTWIVTTFLRAKPLRERNMLTLLFWIETIRDEIEMQDRLVGDLGAADRSCLTDEMQAAREAIASLQEEVISRQGKPHVETAMLAAAHATSDERPHDA